MTSKIRNKQALAEEGGHIYPSVGEPGAWQPVHSHLRCAETPARKGHGPWTSWRGWASPPTLCLGASPRGTAQGGSQAISLTRLVYPQPPQKEALRPRHGPRAAKEAVGQAERGRWVAHSRQGPVCRCPRSSAILRQGEASRGGEEMAGNLGSGVSDCGPATCPLRWVPERGVPSWTPPGPRGKEGSASRCRPTCGSSHARSTMYFLFSLLPLRKA